MKLLTVKDVAAQLQVKEKTVYAWASQRKIPCAKINGVIRFDAKEIEEWLQKCHVQIGQPCTSTGGKRRDSRTDVDTLIENAKRAVHTLRGETRPVASPFREEGANGAL